MSLENKYLSWKKSCTFADYLKFLRFLDWLNQCESDKYRPDDFGAYYSWKKGYNAPACHHEWHNWQVKQCPTDLNHWLMYDDWSRKKYNWKKKDNSTSSSFSTGSSFVTKPVTVPSSSTQPSCSSGSSQPSSSSASSSSQPSSSSTQPSSSSTQPSSSSASSSSQPSSSSTQPSRQGPMSTLPSSITCVSSDILKFSSERKSSSSSTDSSSSSDSSTDDTYSTTSTSSKTVYGYNDFLDDSRYINWKKEATEATYANLLRYKAWVSYTRIPRAIPVSVFNFEAYHQWALGYNVNIRRGDFITWKQSYSYDDYCTWYEYKRWQQAKNVAKRIKEAGWEKGTYDLYQVDKEKKGKLLLDSGKKKLVLRPHVFYEAVTVNDDKC